MLGLGKLDCISIADLKVVALPSVTKTDVSLLWGWIVIVSLIWVCCVKNICFVLTFLGTNRMKCYVCPPVVWGGGSRWWPEDTFGIRIFLTVVKFLTIQEVELFSLILYKLTLKILSAFAATCQRKYCEYSHEEICFMPTI